MANIDLPPKKHKECGSGSFLTFIVPAPDGCNLKCPFCIVRQRKEIMGNNLHPFDLERFILEAEQRVPIFALGIQGYEPLLPASREYTQAILATGQLLDLPTTLVTNGTHLSDAVNWLTKHNLDTIGISLDAATPDAHDKMRGISGAWAATVRGIRRATEVLAPRTHITVTSVLTADHKPLVGMPALLRDLSIANWIVTPLQKIGRNQPGGPAGNREKLYQNLLILQQAANDAGIHLTVDDEFNLLHHDLTVVQHPELAQLNVRTLPENVDLFRVVPSGHISLNHDILREVTSLTPRWLPGEIDAGEFIENLQRSSTRAEIREHNAAGMKRIGILASSPAVASLSVG